MYKLWVGRQLRFLVFLHIVFFCVYSVDIVVGAEGYNFLVWRYVVDDATANAVYIKCIGIHERHATQQEDSPSYRTKRLISWRDKHFQNGFHKRKDANFLRH